MTKSKIAEFVSYLESLDVRILIEGDQNTSVDKLRLRCTAPEGTLTPRLRQELAERKAELLSYLHHQQAPSTQLAPIIKPTEETTLKTVFPLSFAQQRLWFLYQLAPNNPFYNVPAAIRLKGTLNQTALERSFQEIVRRHATLRTTFTTVNGQPVQVIKANVSLELSVVDLQTVAVSERDSSIEMLRERISQQLATAEAQRPFNLTTDPLLRVTLLQFEPTETVLLLTLHHIVADGWSLGILIRELACFYTAFTEGRTPELPSLPIQYTDFAYWQRNELQGEVLEQQLAYWRRQLQDLPVLHLPSDRPRPAVQTYRGTTHPLQISPSLTQALETLSQQSGVSLFMTLLAAFQTLLYRYTGQEDIAIGSPIANRHRSEIEGLIGFFVNSLVLRSDLSGDLTFRKLLKRVRNVALEAYEHQDIPFEKLVEELDPERDLSRNPLFQVAFALQNAPMQPLELPGLSLEPAPLKSVSTRFDLEVHLWEPTHGLRSLWQSQAGLSGFIAYSTDLFDHDRIDRLVGHFQTLLEGIVSNPDARLSDLPLLTSSERRQLLTEWNQTNREHRYDCCFHQIFEAQVQSTPEKIALVSEQGSLSYETLNQQADHLAQRLQQMGIRPNSLVGLCVERSADMVIGILGILKAGGAYVPLDPGYPSDRLQFMLTDTQVSILLTQSWLVESLPASPAQILCLDRNLNGHLNGDLGHRLDDQSLPDHNTIEHLGSRKEATVTPDHLAYVIYTSGSTGIPKGVLLSHRGLCNVVEAQQQIFHPSHESRILQFSSPSFDASIFEIALALGSGSTLYITPRAAQLPGAAFVQFLQDNAITHALLTPAVLAVLPVASLPKLQVLITGGEACSSQVVDRWAANRHFFNAYGPTETTIWATVAKLEPGDNPLTIGRPILNTQVYILDANLNPVPAGIPGELYIGGAGLAQGYLNRPELTAERFVCFAHSSLSSELEKSSDAKLKISPQSLREPTIKLYRTGDRAFYHPDGTIEFLGRVDNQIKIRGFRVELGEVETTLQGHPAIGDAVVIASGSSSEMRLIAYFSLSSVNQGIDANYLHSQPTLLQSLQTQQLQHWQTLYNQTYQPAENPQNAVDTEETATTSALTTQNFNITGWNSSYTEEPIPPEQMQEWVSDRVQQILALKPKRLLEIGCGSGLLLFQIAPHCQQYVGTDFSAVSLETVQNQLHSLNLPHVKLLHRMATDFTGIDAASFDVVILNSIVQYFPSADYLMQVLEGAIQAVSSGGVLFIGDVRSLPLLTAFHTWVQFCQADAALERNPLQQKVERARFEEPELTIDPVFFDLLHKQFSQVQQVNIRLSRGYSQNEMTQFRYNVLLHLQDNEIESNQPVLHSFHSIPEHDWISNPITITAFQQQLIEHQPEVLIVRNVTNSRVNAAVKVANWLRNQASPKTVGRMRDWLNHSDELAIDPQDWWNLETLLPYHVEITWSAQTDTGNYDVLLIRHGVDVGLSKISLGAKRWEAWKTIPVVSRSQDTDSQYTDSQYTNDPLQSQFARQLIPELRQFLRQTLPEYMIPAALIPLETLPLTVSGKVDRVRIANQYDRTLPISDEKTTHAADPATALPTKTEANLIEIWKELLRLKQVNVHDNFFELGGHSLLATQMTSRVRDIFKLELPLKHVFEAPTIAQLAPILETLQDSISTPRMPTLVRLDRSAYRRKRLTTTPDTVQSTLPDNDAQTLPNLYTSASQLNSDQSLSSSPSPITSRSPLVPLTLGQSQHPFFCVHPMFGVVFPYLELAHHLGNNRSFYGLQPLGLDGSTPPLNRIESIAASYIQAIQTLQPHGPYFLGGWSFGGWVAFEMAQQLTQAGQEIGLLAMLDTPAPCSKPSFYQSLKFLLGTALWSTLPYLLDYSAIALSRFQFQKSWFSRWQWSAIGRLISEESRLPLLDESAIRAMLPIVYANSQAAYRYVPQGYPNRITVFKATDQTNAIASDPVLGWGALVNDICLHQVPGNHLSLLKQPHVQTLAQQLGQYLD